MRLAALMLALLSTVASAHAQNCIRNPLGGYDCNNGLSS
jgi:hypothetical protein